MQPQEYVGLSVGQVLAEPDIRDSLGDLEEIEGERYFGALSFGVSFVAEGGRVVAVHIHVLPEGEYRAYPDALPCELRADMTREEVRGLLGTPRSSGETTRIPVLGVSPAWDLFDIESVCLNVQYRLDAPGLSLLTFMLAEVVPR